MVYDIIKQNYVIHHNGLKKIVVKDHKWMSDQTFEKCLIELVEDKKVFKLPEKKVRQRVSVEIGKKYYIKSKGTPMVYYTTQKRLVRLKPNFTKFCKKEMESIIQQFSEFSNLKEKDPTEKEIMDRINKFSTSLFILDNVINSVNSIAHYWQDFRWEIDAWTTKILTFRTIFYGQIRDNHKELYEKIMTENQLDFLKSNQIHPYNLLPKNN